MPKQPMQLSDTMTISRVNQNMEKIIKFHNHAYLAFLWLVQDFGKGVQLKKCPHFSKKEVRPFEKSIQKLP